ncbi:MAG: hypothetical protein ACR2Q4_00390 [Geminicoccaceae bacterium]
MEDVMDGASPSAPRRTGRWIAYLGLVLLLLALGALIYEFVVGLQFGSYRPIAAGELWFKLHAGSLNVSQAVIQRYVHPMVWDPAIITLLQWPAWSIFGAPGAVLIVLFGPWFRTKGQEHADPSET